MDSFGTGETAHQGMGANPAGKNPGDVWTIPTQPYPEAHFATFSEKLVVPMIKSSCPEQICRKCGKARVRMTETDYTTTGTQAGDKQQAGGYQVNRPYTERKEAKHHTAGWSDCGCGEGFRPGIVLDPFSGAGTTAIVAKKLQREYLGIELNPEYVKQSEKRIEKECGTLF